MVSAPIIPPAPGKSIIGSIPRVLRRNGALLMYPAPAQARNILLPQAQEFLTAGNVAKARVYFEAAKKIGVHAQDESQLSKRDVLRTLIQDRQQSGLIRRHRGQDARLQAAAGGPCPRSRLGTEPPSGTDRRPTTHAHVRFPDERRGTATTEKVCRARSCSQTWSNSVRP
jgi:hypothetical protein